MKGLVARNRAKTTRAIACFEAGSRLHAAGDIAGALAEYEKGLTDAPQFAAGHMILGLALAGMQRYQEAEVSLQRALQLDQTLADAHLAIGKLRAVEGDLLATVRACKTALRHDPRNIPALCELWMSADKLGLLQERVDAGRRYVALKPEHKEARWDLALHELTIGDLNAGWEGYVARWSHPYYRTWRYELPAPEWAGEDLTGKHILVWREQGIGDEIMFASCVPQLVAAAGRVTVACTDRLVPLFARSFPDAHVIDARRITPPDVESFDIDYHAAAGALPRYFRPTVASFPTAPAFLSADTAKVRAWRDRMTTLAAGLRVGISWRSGMMTAERAKNYATLDNWGPLLQTPGVTFVNLQYDDCALALATAEDRFGVHVHAWPDLDLRNDLDGTAALISTLDLVITIGNAVGELSGALGIPTWRLSPSPIREWTMLGTDHRPWFPMMRVWQAPTLNDWDGLIARMVPDLEVMVRATSLAAA